MLRRLLGLIIIVVSLILIVLLLWTALRVGPAVDGIVESLDNLLVITDDTLANTTATLTQTRATLVEANSALENAALATTNLSLMMLDMQPLLSSSAQVVTHDVPDNIEAIQDAIPNITQVAGVIDNVLTRLSEFRIDQTIPIPFNPIDLQFDLGIEYNPDQPFDTSIRELGTSLEGMPDELRSLEGDLDSLSTDLEMLTGNIETAATDIGKINEELTLFIPILDEYVDIIGRYQQSLAVLREQVATQLQALGNFIVFIFVLLALTQLAPLYIGWELISGKRSTAADEKEPEPPPPVVIQEKTEIDKPEVVDELIPVPDESLAEAPADAPTVLEQSPPAPDADGDGQAN